jgi:hypothetical protein
VVELGFTFIRLFWWILVVLCCGVLLCFGMGHMLNVGSILSFDSNVLCVFEVSLV